MKKIGLFFLGVFLASFGFSQTDEEVNIMQSLFGMEKREIVAGFVQLDQAQNDIFWSLYDEYEVERKALGKNRLGLIQEYAKNYRGMNDEQAAQFMKDMIAMRNSNDKLLDSYYKKIAKATSPFVGLQFFQVEGYILTAMRMYILEEIPFVQK